MARIGRTTDYPNAFRIQRTCEAGWECSADESSACAAGGRGEEGASCEHRRAIPPPAPILPGRRLVGATFGRRLVGATFGRRLVGATFGRRVVGTTFPPASFAVSSVVQFASLRRALALRVVVPSVKSQCAGLRTACYGAFPSRVRPVSARFSVSSSACSSPPPAGRPCAMREMATGRSCSSSAM